MRAWSCHQCSVTLLPSHSSQRCQVHGMEPKDFSHGTSLCYALHFTATDPSSSTSFMKNCSAKVWPGWNRLWGQSYSQTIFTPSSALQTCTIHYFYPLIISYSLLYMEVPKYTTRLRKKKKKKSPEVVAHLARGRMSKKTSMHQLFISALVGRKFQYCSAMYHLGQSWQCSSEPGDLLPVLDNIQPPQAAQQAWLHFCTLPLQPVLPPFSFYSHGQRCSPGNAVWLEASMCWINPSYHRDFQHQCRDEVMAQGEGNKHTAATHTALLC